MQHDDASGAAIFTVQEVADYLRTDSLTVDELLNSGEIAGFKVGGEWRVLGMAVLDFLHRSIQQAQVAVISRNLPDPKAWARELHKDPEFCALVREQDFPPDSMGALLQQGLALLEAEEGADNVVDICTRNRE